MNPATNAATAGRLRLVGICWRQLPHLVGEWDSRTDRCVWCGLPFPRTDAKLSPFAPTATPPQASAREDASPVRAFDASTPARPDASTADFDARFRAYARDFAARSVNLTAWVQQGNKLPAVYR